MNEPYFLQDTFIIDANHWLCLPDGAVKAILDVISIIRDSDELTKVACQDQHSQTPVTEPAPALKRYLGSLSAMYPAVILMSKLPGLLEFYKAKNIPHQVIINTLSDVGIWLEDYKSKNGVWGLAEIPWLMNHFTGKLFRLGRLQFIQQAFNGQIQVYQNKISKETIAFSKAGIPYRKDGLVDGTCGVSDGKEPWTAQVHIDKKTFTGNPISPLGYAIEKPLTLPLSDWERVFAEGDPVLDLHIAAGSRMDHQSCGESLSQAMGFFPEYFPERPFVGFTCNSWLLAYPYQEMLPPNSNIVKFQREFYLYPALSDEQMAIERVFGRRPTDLSEAPRDTSLRRAIIDHLLSGKELYGAGGFILKRDLDWGHQIYQRDSNLPEANELE